MTFNVENTLPAKTTAPKGNVEGKEQQSALLAVLYQLIGSTSASIEYERVGAKSINGSINGALENLINELHAVPTAKLPKPSYKKVSIGRTKGHWSFVTDPLNGQIEKAWIPGHKKYTYILQNGDAVLAAQEKQNKYSNMSSQLMQQINLINQDIQTGQQRMMTSADLASEAVSEFTAVTRDLLNISMSAIGQPGLKS